MNRIIALAGIEPWPKTFHNCRATRRTELQGEFKTHVVNAWIGHGSAVAEKHYLQVTDDDFDFAAKSCVGLSGGALSANLGKSAEIKTRKNPEETCVPRGLDSTLAPPGGLEEHANYPGKRARLFDLYDTLYDTCVTSGAIRSRLVLCP